ncbi:MAG: thylakoid membrane photosystem I accumulation factor [Thermosynechococcaceae cyanobacterium MS004]|nr:thylakoid membrane photosystem I accumulation factor [Thermosynechococcaceae cyanobacterium MS004]
MAHFGLLIACVLLAIGLIAPAASASLLDDRFDGNIFALYAGNGSLVPPQLTLAQSFKGERPTILTFYIEDSQDCKQFSAIISQLQAYYGRAADIIPINVDAIPVQSSYSIDEPGYYYSGKVPQTLIFDASGKKVLDVVGRATFEQFDDQLREVFNLLPRSESVELRRRPFNEVNAELVK